MYKDEQGHVISGVSVFNKNTEHTASLAEYGEVIDGITDFHGEFQPAAFPPFAALIVQPKEDKAVRAPVPEATHPLSLIRECPAPSPFLVSH